MIKRERKKLVPIDYSAVVAWLNRKGRRISIENLGGGGPHMYEEIDGIVVIDGKNKIQEEQWQATCKLMITDIEPSRLDITTEYSKIKDFGNPSIPVLCWAICEELMNENNVWK